jgi:hypothetical protein
VFKKLLATAAIASLAVGPVLAAPAYAQEEAAGGALLGGTETVIIAVFATAAFVGGVYTVAELSDSDPESP